MHIKWKSEWTLSFLLHILRDNYFILCIGSNSPSLTQQNIYKVRMELWIVHISAICTSYVKWTSLPYFERNIKLLNQGNPVNIIYFDFSKAIDMTKKVKTRLELEKSRLQTITKEWWLAACHLR